MANAAARRPPHGRRRIVLAAALVALVVAGTAVAVEVWTDFLGEQDRVDRESWTPPEDRPVGARIEIERGTDWSFMAWESGRGLCIAWAAGSAESWARACGRGHQSGDEGPEHLIVGLFSTSADAEGLSAVVGAVTADVRRVDVELGDGSTFSAATLDAPALTTIGRFFLMRVPATRLLDLFDRVGLGGHPIRAYSFYDGDGRLLERYVTPRR